jgi:hypothetical protein
VRFARKLTALDVAVAGPWRLAWKDPATAGTEEQLRQRETELKTWLEQGAADEEVPSRIVKS